MRYINKITGVIVDPSSKLAAQSFLNPPWEEVKVCSKSEKTPTSAENTQTNTSPADTEVTAKTENAGRKSAKATKKSS